jgi:PKD repeat protein
MTRHAVSRLSMAFVVFVLLGLCIFWFTDVRAAPLAWSTGSVSVGGDLHFQGTIPPPPSLAVLVYRPHGDACVTYNFWYYVAVTNTGSIALHNMVVTDTLPAGIEPGSVRTGVGPPYTESPGGTFDGVNTVTWNITSLEPQASAWMWIMARTYSWVEGTCMTDRVWVDADELGLPIQASDVYCVPDGPTADLGAVPTSCCAPLTVQFTDLTVAGDNPVVSWLWDFGDGTTSTQQNPSHTYAAGIWTVTLTVTDQHGCMDTKVKTQYIDSNAPPTAEFSSAPTSCCAPLAVQFTDLSVAGDNPVVSWLWDFGDGTTSTQQNPSHTYAAGLWTVTLTLTDEHGCTDTEVKTQYIHSNALPTAGFSARATSGCAPLAVQFKDLSVAGDNPLVSWLWDFGDGTTSTQQNPSHMYAAGLWTVTLTVTDEHGCTDTEVKTQYINSNEPPAAAFSAAPTSCCAPLTVQFTDLSAAGHSPLVSWLWSFGDGTTSTEQNPSHIYAAGLWTVTLTVTDEHGCTDTEVKTQYIDSNAPPTAAFSAAPTGAPLAVQFTDLSVAGDNPLVSWLWQFGDGSTSTNQNPMHVYTTAGVYTATLAVTDAHGCQSTTQQSIQVQAPFTGPYRIYLPLVYSPFLPPLP